MERERIKGGIVGICVGDALGLPVKYRSRSYLKGDPVNEMIGFGTHNQPPGTYSSDSSLALCTTECLSAGFSLAGVAARLVLHANESYWSAREEPVELPAALLDSLERLTDPETHLESAAGNEGEDAAVGVFCRVLPVATTLKGLSFEERFKRIGQVSSLTNGSMRMCLGSFILAELALELIQTGNPSVAYRRAAERVRTQLGAEPELSSYRRVLQGEIHALEETAVSSDGKGVSTVEAAIWSLLTTGSFRDAVLKAVNLGGETDTIAGVTGGLAGFAYGLGAIPREWVGQLVKSQEILALSERLFQQVAPSR